MSERKVLNKYYPPDYDPSKIPRIKRKSKQNDVRIMAPFNMRCKTCGNYIANATKFNAKKETIEDETYNKLTIYRFYIKCPRCMASIIFKTNPKDQSYEVEHGATEKYAALKLAEKQAREEAEAEEEEEKINPMKHLENRTKASRQQMEASEQIQSLRSIKHKHRKVDIDAIISSKREEANDLIAIELKQEEDEVREMAKKILKRKIDMPTSDLVPSQSSTSVPGSLSKKVPNSKLSCSLQSLKKKIKITPKATSRTDPEHIDTNKAGGNS